MVSHITRLCVQRLVRADTLEKLISSPLAPRGWNQPADSPYTWQNAGSLIAWFMGPTWGPSGADRTQVGPMLAPWTVPSRKRFMTVSCLVFPSENRIRLVRVKRCHCWTSYSPDDINHYCQRKLLRQQQNWSPTAFQMCPMLHWQAIQVWDGFSNESQTHSFHTKKLTANAKAHTLPL